MEYVILFYEGKEEMAERTHPEKSEAYWGGWMNYSKAVDEAGIGRGGAGLQTPDTATVLSLKNGKKHVQDGPYADTKEQLGGFSIIDVPNLDAAIEWASKSPAFAKGRIEIRPALQGP